MGRLIELFLPDRTSVVLTESLYKQCRPQSGNETLGGETINWGRRNCSLYSLTEQSEKKNHPSWASCLLVPTKRALTCFWLCGCMLHVRVYCTSGAPCRVSASPGYWPSSANGALLRRERLGLCPLTPHSVLDVGFIPFCSSVTKQLVTSPCHRGGHGLGTSAGTAWVRNRAKKQAQNNLECRNLFLIYLYLFCIHQCRCDCICTGCASAGWWFGCHNVNWITLAHGSGALCSWVKMSSLFCTTPLCK